MDCDLPLAFSTQPSYADPYKPLRATKKALRVNSAIRVLAVANIMSTLRSLDFAAVHHDDPDSPYGFCKLTNNNDCIVIKESRVAPSATISFEGYLSLALITSMKKTPCGIFELWSFSKVAFVHPFMGIYRFCVSCYTPNTSNSQLCEHCTSHLAEHFPVVCTKLLLLRQLVPTCDVFCEIVKAIRPIW